MRLLRSMIVGWMVLWLGASGALAAVMPWCDHALRTDAPAGMDAHAHDAHAGHDEGMASDMETGHAGHDRTDSGAGHPGMACDDCGSCQLTCGAMPAAALPDGSTRLHAVRETVVLNPFLGWFPDQPYHPPRNFLPA